jgi:hypothetical protein
VAGPDADGRCADLSEAAGESLAATAVTARSWLLVEVPGAWPRDVSEPGALPPAAEAAVGAWLAETPRSRLQFVRRPGQTGGARSGATRLAYVVRSEEGAGEVRRFELDDLDALSTADLADGGDPIDTSLVLVCAHGSRDRCCSLRGTAVFGALAGRLGAEELWISSHLGGHRFAANVVVLPAGLQFGRVTPDEAPFVVARALSGRIELERYRGRTSYEAVAQAGERAVRATEGLDGVDDLALVAQENARARFRALDGREWETEASETESPPVPASCGDDPAPQRAFVARIVASSGRTGPAPTSGAAGTRGR